MSDSDKAIIFDIIRNTFVDGPGIRTSVFFKGCNLRCAWCHNPESQRFGREMMFYKSKCTGCGKCKEVCTYSLEKCDLCGKCELFCPRDARKICGREMSADEVFAEIVKDRAFYENSGGGVTFSGGECMLRFDFLLSILKKCRESGIHTAVDTAGHIEWRKFEEVLPYVGLFLYDIKCMDGEKHKKYVGVGNELILDNLKKLLERGARVWVRVPTIPSVNDSEEEMRKIRDFFREYGEPEKIELLPYHRLGENKYAALGGESSEFEVPTKEKIKELYDLIRS